MNNCYLQNPIKVVVYDPKTNENLQTYVFLGDIPSTVKNAVYSYKNIIDRKARNQPISKIDAKKYESILRDFYGDSWERKLHAISKQKAYNSKQKAYNSKQKAYNSKQEAHATKTKKKKRGGADTEESLTLLADRMFAGGDDAGDIAGIDIGEIDRLLNLDTTEQKTEIDTSDTGRYGKISEDVEAQDTLEAESDTIARNLRKAADTTDTSADTFTVSSQSPASALMSIDISGTDFKPKYGRDGGTVYISDVKIYPEDKFSDLKNKIYMSINIPTYRQHIYWMQKGRVTTPYKLYTSKIYPVDIRTLFSGTHKQEIIGIPIDRELYNEREELKVDANDTFQIIANLDDWYETFYVCDIAEYIEVKRTQIINIIKDKYQLDLFYYGFVVKYWPQLVHEAFIEYAVSETTLMQKFPDLAPPISYIRKVCNAEADILDKNYKSVRKILELESSSKSHKRIYVAMTNTVATTNTEPKMIINIRNLFDKLHTSTCYPEIKAFVEYGNRSYLLEKSFSRNQSRILFPTNMKSGLIIAISLRKKDQETYHPAVKMTAEAEQSKYMFVNILPNGKYFVKSLWEEEEEYQFEDILKFMKKFTDPLFRVINSFSKYIFSYDPSNKGFPLLTEHNVKYSSITVSILWKHVMSSSVYRFIKSLWEPYMRANILSPHGISQSDVTSFMFHKGMVEFDSSLIDRVMVAARIVASRNQYSHLTNSTIKQKWNQLYGGRIFRMHHRTTDIKFEAVNMHEKEFRLLHRYILVFVSAAMCNPRFKEIKIEKVFQVGAENVKKLRKLQETDPDLYNLKKFGSKKMYSILCQNPRQPIIYTEDEVERMSAKDKSKLTEYWNFTLDREAHYGCNNPKYPHMSFIVGVHPKNYCLPCCSKKSFVGEESKKTHINKVCSENYEFTKKDAFDEAKSRHIMVYGKSVDPGRISQLPGSAIRDLLYNSLSDENLQYYIFGVPQKFPSVKNTGILYSLAESLSMSPQKLVSDLIKDLEKMPEIFKTLLNGTLLSSFTDIRDLTDTMRTLFIDRSGKEFITSRFKKWSELFSELAMLFLRVYIFVFIDYTGRGESTDLFISDAMKSELLYLASAGISATESSLDKKYVLIIRRQSEYYPIFVIDSRIFFKTNIPSQKLFTGNDTVVKHLYSLVSSSMVVEANIIGEKTTEKKITLQVVKEFVEDAKSYTIATKYINKRNLCYAVLLKETGKSKSNVYVPVAYSPHINDGIPVEFTLFEEEMPSIAAEEIISYAHEINKFIKKKYLVGKSSSGESIHEYELVNFTILHSHEGIVSSALADNIYYFKAIPNSEAEKLFKEFGAKIEPVQYRFEEVNRAIAKNEPPVKIKQDILTGALYKNYLYQLFTLEFVNYVGKEINVAMRENIIKRINSTDFKKNFGEFQANLDEMLDEYPDDAKILKSQISSFYYGDFDKKKLIETIGLTRYQFDNITINRLKKSSRANIKEELKVIARDFASEEEFVASADDKFPNIYLPCDVISADENAPYCAKKKLIVGDMMDTLADILASDITNPLKEKYLLSGSFSDNIIDYFNFDSDPREIIVITKIE